MCTCAARLRASRGGCCIMHRNEYVKFEGASHHASYMLHEMVFVILNDVLLLSPHGQV